MPYRALVLDSAAISRFLAGLAIPARWWTEFDFGDDRSLYYSFFVNDFCFILSKDSRLDNPRLIIKLEDGKLFSGLIDETDRIEALHRCLSAAQRFFEGKTPIPASWKPYSMDDVKSFQSNNKTTGETRRIVARFAVLDAKSVYAFDLTSKQAEFDTISVDEHCFNEANSRMKVAHR